MTDEIGPKAPAPGPDSDGPTGLIDSVDAVLAVLLIVLCGSLYALTSDFPVPGAFLGENVLPEQFPRLLLVTIGVLSMLLPLEHRLELERWPLIRKSRSAPIGAGTFTTIGFLILLVVAAEWVGTILTIFLAATGLPLLWGERRWLLILTYSVLFTGLVTYVFSIVLGVYFEPGVLGLSLR
ncbi:MAG: tripartite tricarboxylate transporter TctB family protein [Inquilinus sp.]|nr:tripartite tricarboxylate transporter TctB family protein [Inquilinus sp.]